MFSISPVGPALVFDDIPGADDIATSVADLTAGFIGDQVEEHLKAWVRIVVLDVLMLSRFAWVLDEEYGPDQFQLLIQNVQSTKGKVPAKLHRIRQTLIDGLDFLGPTGVMDAVPVNVYRDRMHQVACHFALCQGASS